jgi:hypothetical protein
MAIKRRPGRIKIEGDWESAIGEALGKKRPAGGWPENPKRAAKRRAKRRKKRAAK